MHNENLNNRRCDGPGKLVKQTSFKVKTWGNNSKGTIHYQIEIYCSRIQFIVNLTTVTKLSSEPLRLL